MRQFTGLLLFLLSYTSRNWRKVDESNAIAECIDNPPGSNRFANHLAVPSGGDGATRTRIALSSIGRLATCWVNQFPYVSKKRKPLISERPAHPSNLCRKPLHGNPRRWRG